MVVKIAKNWVKVALEAVKIALQLEPDKLFCLKSRRIEGKGFVLVTCQTFRLVITPVNIFFSRC